MMILNKTFKDFLLHDVNNVFVNQDEFAEKAIIEGVEMDIVPDTDLISPADKKYQVAAYDVVFHVASSYFEDIPQAEKLMNFNGRDYMIESVSNDMGMLKITLSRNNS